ncbi:MAG: apolipoprotein N-acyltransferase [Pseudomonas fluorescens]|nr:MAG: apolipoprotein N-acyltransferase [Pseudomonas fluorescens]
MVRPSLPAFQQWLTERGQKPLGVWVLVLGASMTLGFAPFGLWPVALLSLAGLWWLVRHAASSKQAAGAALVWGMGHQVTALYWLPWAFFKDAGGSWLAAIGGGVPAVLGLALFGALAYILPSMLAWQVGRRTHWTLAALVWVVLWVVLEFIKGLHPMGFPWLPVGAVFATSLTLMQMASVGGVWLLSLLLLSMAVLLNAKLWRVQAISLALLLGMMAFGILRLAQNPEVAGTDMVRVVQPNIQSAHKWDAQMRWAFLQETLAVALDGGDSVPATVIMPETAVAFYLDEEDDVRRAIAARLAARMPEQGALFTGTVRREPKPHAVAGSLPNFYNSFGIMDTQGNLRGVYDKRLLVPFGEYIPGRSFLESLPLPVTLRTLSQSRIDFTHGTRSPVLSTPAGDAVALICYEGIFPLQVAEASAHARYLANITNDSWFTGTIALYQHAALSRLRAVETGVPLVRVANTGLTLVYDGMGREILRLPINTALHKDVALPPALPETPFVKVVKLLLG